MDIIKPRPEEEIKATIKQEELKREFKEICTEAGSKQFEISKLQAQLYLLNEKLFKLNEVFFETDLKIRGVSSKEIEVPLQKKETISAP